MLVVAGYIVEVEDHILSGKPLDINIFTMFWGNLNIFQFSLFRQFQKVPDVMSLCLLINSNITGMKIF